jgi:hypothetical protein
MRVVFLLCFAAVQTFAATWSGMLVDSNCYASEQRNVNSKDTLTNVDRDQNLEIQMCYAKPHTKSFAVVDQNGGSFGLDAAGNAKAAALVQGANLHHRVYVTVTGQMTGGIITVKSMSAK